MLSSIFDSLFIAFQISYIKTILEIKKVVNLKKTNYTKRFYEIVRELVKYTYYKDGVF